MIRRLSLPVVETMFGHNAAGLWTPYLRRAQWGPWFAHCFYRGDGDPDPHDHRRAFWTFPLTAYVEEVLGDDGFEVRRVEAFRIHRRPATYRHRVLGRAGRGVEVVPGAILTLGRWSRAAPPREWGFWRDENGERRFVPWRAYIYGEAR